MNKVDLHVHSTKSDGTFTPSELVDYALEKGLSAFALTDHDTINGLEEAVSYGKDKPLEIIRGIEFSTEYHGRDVHILGLCINDKTPAFTQKLQAFQESRCNRNEKMCSRLRAAGIDISYRGLQEAFPEAVITRAHYARYLLEYGYVNSMEEAFARYVGDHAPCFVPREKVTPEQAVELVLEAEGVPILAHPVLYRMSDSKLEKLVASLKEAGLMGIEAVYSTYNAKEERDMKRLAEKYRLCISGGSDFHGSNKPGLDMGTGYGRLFIPESILDGVKAAGKNAGESTAPVSGKLHLHGNPG